MEEHVAAIKGDGSQRVRTKEIPRKFLYEYISMARVGGRRARAAKRAIGLWLNW